MDIILYTDPLFEFLSLPPDAMLWRLLVLYAWIPFLFTFMFMLWEWYVYELQNKWGAAQKDVLLAIDIPKGNEQSPKAVENFFTYLAGAHGTLNLVDKYVEGKYQLYFSLEIVSIGGYTQFIIHTPVSFRSLVEAGLYAQYPDAEITEIQDYTTGFPRVFPDDEYDIWGAEFIPTASTDLFPIKTYKEFEHQYGKPEMQFRDPMSALMDLCSSLRAGENLWYQILVRPTNTDWVKKGAPAIAKILGEKAKSNPGPLNWLADAFADALGYLSGVQFNVKLEEKKVEAKKMMDLKPEEKKQIEGIQEKISKLGFECKLRMVYMARKDVKNNPKVVNGFVGYIKQFTYNDLNALKPDTKVTQTSTAYFMKDYRLNIRKGRIARNYMGRSMWRGRMPFMLNIEELATLWHFPIEHVVKAPLIQKTPGKKAEPPTSLPIHDEVSNATELINEIFVSDQPVKQPQSTYKPENIFDLESEEQAVAPDRYDGGTIGHDYNTENDPFADIFVEPDAKPAPKSPERSESEAAGGDGAPPPNLPFV
jgi:hypothetical protein